MQCTRNRKDPNSRDVRAKALSISTITTHGINDRYRVAEIAEKPLYRVTCGDIGTKAEDVEKVRGYT